MYLVFALGSFLFALFTFHVLFVIWRKVGRRFWLVLEYVYYSIGMIGVLVSAFALASSSDKALIEVEIQRIEYEVDNVADRLRADKVEACSPRGEDGVPSNGQACFAYSMALPIIDVWKRHEDFPIAGIPSCEEITAYFEDNDEIFGISRGYQAQWVAKHTNIEAIHPLCISEEHYQRRNALRFDLNRKLDPNSIHSSMNHIGELLPCYYRYCSVIVFRPYDIELRRIDARRIELTEKKVHVDARVKYAEKAKWSGIFLVCMALALRLTKTSSEFISG